MQIFPNSPNKKKDIYPAYMRKGAQAVPGAEITEEPVDDAFDAIKDLPMFGDQSPAPVADDTIDSPPVGEVPGEVPSEVPAAAPAEVPVADAAPAGSVGESLDKAKEALETAEVAIADAAEAVKAGEGSATAEIEVEIEDVDKKPEGDKEDKKDKKDDKPCDDKPCDKKDEECKDDTKPDFLKKESDPGKEACAEDKKPAVKEDKPKDNVEAAAIGGFIRMANLSAQTRKEVYDYWKALGMPEEWCKALTKSEG
jgi:hypothetical protein